MVHVLIAYWAASFIALMYTSASLHFEFLRVVGRKDLKETKPHITLWDVVTVLALSPATIGLIITDDGQKAFREVVAERFTKNQQNQFTREEGQRIVAWVEGQRPPRNNS